MSDARLVEVLGVPCLAADLDEATARILELVSAGEGGYVSTCNVHVVVTANQDARYLGALAGAKLRVPDGWPVAWMQRRQGATWARRVPGPDLMERLLDHGRVHRLSHYMLGSTPSVLSALEARIEERFPGAEIAGSFSPAFEPVASRPDPTIVDRLRAAQPSIVWVGLGAPKQDFWMQTYGESLAPSVLIGVGAAFDFMSGARPRAPVWMRQSGLEWAFRLASEPRRLTPRYIRTNTQFVLRAASSLIQNGERRDWGPG